MIHFLRTYGKPELIWFPLFAGSWLAMAKTPTDAIMYVAVATQQVQLLREARNARVARLPGGQVRSFIYALAFQLGVVIVITLVRHFVRKDIGWAESAVNLSCFLISAALFSLGHAAWRRGRTGRWLVYLSQERPAMIRRLVLAALLPTPALLLIFAMSSLSLSGFSIGLAAATAAALRTFAVAFAGFGTGQPMHTWRGRQSLRKESRFWAVVGAVIATVVTWVEVSLWRIFSPETLLSDQASLFAFVAITGLIALGTSVAFRSPSKMSWVLGMAGSFVVQWLGLTGVLAWSPSRTSSTDPVIASLAIVGTLLATLALIYFWDRTRRHRDVHRIFAPA